jgi:hypothetical protein
VPFLYETVAFGAWLHGACSDFSKAACDSKTCSKAACHLENATMNALDKIDKMNSKESRNRNSDAAFGTIFRIKKCFQKRK